MDADAEGDAGYGSVEIAEDGVEVESLFVFVVGSAEIGVAAAMGVDVHEQVGLVAAGCRDVAQAGILTRLDDGYHSCQSERWRRTLR